MPCLRVAQLSDTHLSLAGHYRGRSSQKALVDALDAAQQGGADLLILSGDLAQDVAPLTYAWLVEQLMGRNIPWHWVAGNHDHPALMREWAATEWVVEYQGWRFVGLETHQPHQVAGCLSDDALDQLRQLACPPAGQPILPTLLVMHHPPYDPAQPWLHPIGLKNQAAFWGALGDLASSSTGVHTQGGLKGILAGHWHQGVQLTHLALPCWVAPSTVMQFCDRADQFSLAPEQGGGLRWLEMYATGDIISSLQYWAL